MKNVYMRDNNSIFKISIYYFISLLPLIIYGFYKNGIYLYLHNYTNVFGMFKPLFLTLIGAILGASVNFIYEKIIKKKNLKLKEILFSSFHIVYGLLIASLASINVNVLLFSLIAFSVLMVSKMLPNKTINSVSLASLLIILATYIFSKFTYFNAYESSKIFNLDAIDYLFGRGSGGINTTCVAFLILSLIVLWNLSTYKKDIPLYSTISFASLIIIYCIYKNNIANIFDMLFTNGILFSYIFVATDSESSCYTRIGQKIYGILVGVITFILYLINPTLASLGAIFIVSILSKVIDMKFE